MPVAEYLTGEGPESTAIRAHRRALAGESVSYEQALAGRVYQTHVEPLRDAEGEIAGTIGIGLDVTERQRAEEALRREKERAQVTLASIGDGVIRTDADGRVDYLNPVAERLTGWPATRRAAAPLDEIYQVVDEEHPASRSEPAGALPAREPAGDAARAAAPAARRDGSEFVDPRLGGADPRPPTADRSAPSWSSRTSPSCAAWSAR